MGVPWLLLVLLGRALRRPAPTVAAANGVAGPHHRATALDGNGAVGNGNGDGAAPDGDPERVMQK
jgi:hypothetical protein